MDTTTQGKLLNWTEIKIYADHVRQEGIKQFINLYRKVKDRKAEPFVWGDEIENILVKLDDVKKTARVLPKNTQLLPHLKANSTSESRDNNGSIWMTEYGSNQLESTPARPFNSDFPSFRLVEANMKQRREELKKVLDGANGETCLTITQLPRFGCKNFSAMYDSGPGSSEITKSVFYPDITVTPLARYIGSEVNTRKQREERVSINVPVFRDRNTPSPFRDEYTQHPDAEIAKRTKLDFIHADCSVAAAAFSCLQVTFQASDVTQAKYLYDQLIPICPIMLALSAATPIFRGYLTDEDCRWRAFSESMDGRSKEERGLKPLEKCKFVIPKSRFDSVSLYLTADNAAFNDIAAPHDEIMLQQLLNGGVDVDLARNIANIFIRDPLTLYEDTIHQNEEDTGHFYNIFSTNWMSLRLKPPPVEGNIGWRVEFRPLDVQLTDFENAAYVTFVMLLVRAIDKFKLNLAIPISKVDSNMSEAQSRDAVKVKTFFFKETLELRPEGKDTYSQMSIDVIMNGGVTSSGAVFIGLIPMVKRYIDTAGDTDEATCVIISRYLQLISDRAAGRVNTLAGWIRNVVAEHPDYKNDSVITERINYDLVKLFSDISDGMVESQHLFKHVTVSPSGRIGD